jgi:hypothetical protein
MGTAAVQGAPGVYRAMPPLPPLISQLITKQRPVPYNAEAPNSQRDAEAREAREVPPCRSITMILNNPPRQKPINLRIGFEAGFFLRECVENFVPALSAD